MSLHVRSGLRIVCMTSDSLLLKILQNVGNPGPTDVLYKRRLPASADDDSSKHWSQLRSSLLPHTAGATYLLISIGTESKETGVSQLWGGTFTSVAIQCNLWQRWPEGSITHIPKFSLFRPHCSLLDFSVTP